MQTGRGATTTWTSYNLPASITNGSLSSTFSYKPDRGYWRQIAQYASGSETTIYVGGILEKVISGGGTDYRHMIRAGSATIVVTRSTGTNNKTYYVTQDNLSSSAVVTDDATPTPNVIVKESFAAYGARRNNVGWTGSPTSTDLTAIANTTRRGYTGHTELDNLTLIHMNGRVYDPMIGRFISGDPYLDAGLGSQGLNRFTYVGNSVLSLSDASGFATQRGFTLRAWINPNEIAPAYHTGEVNDPIEVSAHQRDQSWWISEINITANSHPNVGNNGGGSGGGGGDSAPIDTVIVTASNTQPQSQQCTKAGSNWSVLDYLPSVDLPSLPDGLVDFSAGLGDALLFGLGNPIRDLLGINGSVDRSTGAYSAGGWTSFGFGVSRLGYAAAVKGYSVVAQSGAAASAFRSAMRLPGAPVRDLTKYTTDAALRAAAGRSNPLVNAAGAGVAAAGAYGATVGCP